MPSKTDRRNMIYRTVNLDLTTSGKNIEGVSILRIENDYKFDYERQKT
jgi:hypothetical protein